MRENMTFWVNLRILVEKYEQFQAGIKVASIEQVATNYLNVVMQVMA